MIKKFLFLFCLISFFVSTSFATPPPPKENMFPIQSVTLTYDSAKGLLHVEAAHPSQNWEIDYVRMMTVSLNGQEVSNENYDHQTEAGGFSENVPVTAKVGDVITVVVYSTQGNSISQDLTVAQSEITTSSSQGATDTTNSTTDNTAN
jgi:hypothetical protein